MRSQIVYLSLIFHIIVVMAPDWRLQVEHSYGQSSCPPTSSDIEGPYYVPGAPRRSKIGSGLIIRGNVISNEGCSPLVGARIEWWQVNPEGVYDDAHRATQLTDTDGTYRLETHRPVSYFRRPPHVHVKVFAAGHETLTTQIYPKINEKDIRFDFVLRKR